MKPERWRQIDTLLGEALELESSRRADFLNEACAGDEELRNRVDALLSAHAQAESFIEIPALALAAEAVADETRSMVGRRLNHYHVSELVGAGGMGAVWKARDTTLDRDVAIKTFAERLDPHKDPLARFEREAKLLASLNHPNIATIHGFEEDQGIRFLILEFIDGETLADRLRRGAIPLEESLRLARQISEALDAAHEKGVIHRDLKPANIKITAEGIVKVLDFGLAKALEVADSPSTNIEATDERTIVGTAAYMAPEQLVGRKVDKRADIWAFGVLLYEMVTGSRPFQGADSAETLSSVVTKEPDLERVPPSLRNLLRKCLEKDPKNRLRDIADAWELVRDPSVAADAPHAQPGWRLAMLPWVTAAVLGIVVVALSLLWPKPAPPQVLRSQIYNPPGSLIPHGTPAISSNSLAYVARDSQGVQRIYVKRHEDVDSRVLPGTEGAMRLFWSAGEEFLAFTIKGRLLWIDPFRGGSARDLTAISAPWQVAGNQNDEIIARDKSGLFLISAEGDTRTPIPNSGDMHFPTFLGDGKRFLAQVRDEKKGSSIYLAGLDPRQRTLVIDNVLSAPILARTPRGKTYLLFVPSDRIGTDLLAYEFDEASGRVVGDSELVVPNIAMVGDPAVRPAVGVSPDGDLAYQIGAEVTPQLVFVDRSGNLISTLSPELSVEIPRLSPDESLVVGGRRSGGEDIWIIDPKQKSPPERKTFDDTSDSYPIWAGDGTRRVAYRRAGHGIYILDPIRPGEPQLLTESPGAPTSWHGQYLLYTFPLLGRGNSRIHLLDIAAWKARELEFPFGRCAGAVFSADGKYIAFDCDSEGRRQVYVQPISGGEPLGKPLKVSENGGGLARWRGDGKELFFISPENNLMAAAIGPGALTVAPPQKLFDLGSVTNRDIYSDRNGYDVTLDGRQFLVVSEPDNVASNPDLFLMNTDGTDQTWLIRGGSPTWSPDGKNLAYHASASGIGRPIKGDLGAATSDSDIFVINVDDALAGLEGRRNITNNPEAIDEDPDWSSDGEKIVFTSHSIFDNPLNSVTAEIYVINADGTGVPVQLTDNEEEERAPAWSPDGTRIVYMCRKLASDGMMRFAVCIMNADGTGQVRLTDTGFTPTFSPDGQKILFHKLDDQLWVMNADGTGQVQRTFPPGLNALANWGVRRAHTAP